MKLMRHGLRNYGLISLLLLAIIGSLQGCAIVAAGGAGAAVANDRRTTGTMIDDQSIELQISKAVHDGAELENRTHINATSFNGVVLLTGEAPTAALRDRVVDLARNVEKVRRVHNEIVIAEPSSKKSRGLDTWITTKVKGRHFRNDNVSAGHVKVVTENGVVYLMGIVSRAEATAAAEDARYIDNVTRVVTLFEYRD